MPDRLKLHAFERGRNSMKVYLMRETPTHAIPADEYSGRFDGFSIGSISLAPRTLGVERAHVHGRNAGTCGEAPGADPAFAERPASVSTGSTPLSRARSAS